MWGIKEQGHGKDPVNLQSPTCVTLNDTPDPPPIPGKVVRISWPNRLTEEELIATPPNVLHGIARDRRGCRQT